MCRAVRPPSLRSELLLVLSGSWSFMKICNNQTTTSNWNCFLTIKINNDPWKCLKDKNTLYLVHRSRSGRMPVRLGQWQRGAATLWFWDRLDPAVLQLHAGDTGLFSTKRMRCWGELYGLWKWWMLWFLFYVIRCHWFVFFVAQQMCIPLPMILFKNIYHKKMP